VRIRVCKLNKHQFATANEDWARIITSVEAFVFLNAHLNKNVVGDDRRLIEDTSGCLGSW